MSRGIKVGTLTGGGLEPLVILGYTEGDPEAHVPDSHVRLFNPTQAIALASTLTEAALSIKPDWDVWSAGNVNPGEC